MDRKTSLILLLTTGCWRKREHWPAHTIFPRGESLPLSPYDSDQHFSNPSSSSSILLEKSQYFAFTPYISRVCEELAQKREGHVPTDNHLRYIVQLQRLIGEVNETAARGSLEPPSREEAAAILQRVKQAGDNIKATLPFPQSDSRKPVSLFSQSIGIRYRQLIRGTPALILMQLNLLELLLSQMTSSGGPFGLDRFADAADSQVRPAEENHATLVNWLSTSISAARSLVSAILVLPPGEEGAVSNIEWIATQCALSLAVRLDLVAAYGSASESTRHLGRFLDMPHTLRHIVMRLESAASSDVDATGDRDTFYHLAHRARRLESWCLRRHEQAKVHAARRETRGDGSRQSGTTSEEPRGMDPRSDTASVMASFPSVTNDGNETWNPSVNWDGDDSEMTPMGDFLFSDLLQFPTDFGFSQS